MSILYLLQPGFSQLTMPLPSPSVLTGSLATITSMLISDHFYDALMVDTLFEELPTEMECTASGSLFYVGEV